MYIHDQFNCDDLDKQITFINDNSFGIIVSNFDGNSFATHIPFLVEKTDAGVVLLGHIAKANSQWRTIQGKESLIIFHGAHAYISPTWYTDPGVPTWNYTAVHVYGNVCLIEDRDKLHEIVLNLTEKYESAHEDPWIPDYPAEMLNGIIGLKVDVHKLEGNFKLNQNRSQGDRDGVIANLNLSGSDNDVTIAQQMSQL